MTELKKTREEVQSLRSQLSAAVEESAEMKKDLATLSKEAANMESRLNAEVYNFGLHPPMCSIAAGPSRCQEMCNQLCDHLQLQYPGAIGPWPQSSFCFVREFMTSFAQSAQPPDRCRLLTARAPRRRTPHCRMSSAHSRSSCPARRVSLRLSRPPVRLLAALCFRLF